MQEFWLIGIDEAGRGPLAGPVAVGVVKVPDDFDWNSIPGVGDSKKISEKKREVIFKRALELQGLGALDFKVELISASYIDTNGISAAIKKGIADAFHALALVPEHCFVQLDGSLKAPEQFNQETIIKGDSKERSIGLASILAKVTRDTYMQDVATVIPGYSFEVHKGYGTKRHRQVIFEKGVSKEHRVTYCQNRHMWGTV